MRVLLLDDNLMSAHRLATALERLGHTVTVATDPSELADAERVVVNLGSRSLGGVEAVRQLKADHPELPVVGFCGHTEVEIRQAAKAAGVDRLFTNSSLAQEPGKLVE